MIGLKKEKKLISINRFHSGSATLNQYNIYKNYTFFNQEWIDLLDKKSKLRSFFEKDKKVIITPFYEDTYQSLMIVALNFFKESMKVFTAISLN